MFEATHFDENPLLHQVNRQRRLKIVFEINPLTEMPPDIPIDQNWLLDGMSPRISPPNNIPALKLNLDGFYKHTIAELFGDAITVKDVVQYVANYGGAIHKSTPDTPMTQALERISQAMEIGGVPSVLRTLLGISDVTIAACTPLYEAIQKEEPG